MFANQNQTYRIVSHVDISRGSIWLHRHTDQIDFGQTCVDYVGCRYEVLPRGVFAIETPTERDRRRTMPVDKPRGGDAVILATSWMEAKQGDIGIIEGFCDREPQDDEIQITFHYSAFVGEAPELASVSGGPGTIATPISELRLLPDPFEYIAWTWRDGRASGGNGVQYLRKARLWEWTPVLA